MRIILLFLLEFIGFQLVFAVLYILVEFEFFFALWQSIHKTEFNTFFRLTHINRKILQLCVSMYFDRNQFIHSLNVSE